LQIGCKVLPYFYINIIIDAIDKYFGKKIFNKAATRLVTFAQYEIRALKATIEKEEIKRLRSFITKDLKLYRNIYEMICLDANSERSLILIRLCAPIVFEKKGIKTISHSAETWRKEVLTIDYGYEDKKKAIDRLCYSSLELIFMRACAAELRSIIAFIVDDTEKLADFNVSEWVHL
jgi:hypothetical protein